MKRKGEEREQTNGETERERACVCMLVGTEDSVSRHPQTAWIEKHIWLIDGRHLWSISEDILGTIRNDVSHGWPDIWLRYLDRRQFQKEGLSDNGNFRAIGFYNESNILESSSILIYLIPGTQYLYTEYGGKPDWLKGVIIKREQLWAASLHLIKGF